uniref:hypothetical protein n=1 Tax=Sphingomonas bacterium TaxID=1895847 RepID=UPI002603BB67|nr:hypothetical protein [Sphingomonas bacterium]
MWIGISRPIACGRSFGVFLIIVFLARFAGRFDESAAGGLLNQDRPIAGIDGVGQFR